MAIMQCACRRRGRKVKELQAKITELEAQSSEGSATSVMEKSEERPVDVGTALTAGCLDRLAVQRLKVPSRTPTNASNRTERTLVDGQSDGDHKANMTYVPQRYLAPSPVPPSTQIDQPAFPAQGMSRAAAPRSDYQGFSSPSARPLNQTTGAHTSTNAMYGTHPISQVQPSHPPNPSPQQEPWTARSMPEVLHHPSTAEYFPSVTPRTPLPASSLPPPTFASVPAYVSGPRPPPRSCPTFPPPPMLRPGVRFIEHGFAPETTLAYGNESDGADPNGLSSTGMEAKSSSPEHESSPIFMAQTTPNNLTQHVQPEDARSYFDPVPAFEEESTHPGSPLPESWATTISGSYPPPIPGAFALPSQSPLSSLAASASAEAAMTSPPVVEDEDVSTARKKAGHTTLFNSIEAMTIGATALTVPDLPLQVSSMGWLMEELVLSPTEKGENKRTA
jgi:hypothetical protein